tara:strand:- start:150 stop:365 length:216 start_codon:yes stop_codon:yes gene_type:complete
MNKKKINFSTMLFVLVFPLILNLNKGYNGFVPLLVKESINKWDVYPMKTNADNSLLIIDKMRYKEIGVNNE